VILEDFRARRAGRENCGDGFEGQASGGGERFLYILHDGAGEGRRFEARRAIRVVRQPADVARRRAGGAGRELDRSLRDTGDLFAAERDFAADGTASKVGLTDLTRTASSSVHNLAVLSHYVCRGEGQAVSSAMHQEAERS